ncbi:glycosyltransferase family 2 protein [Alcaligenaceae bacterium]|nr:glycosyltransferase family 2 protein [Alcaligenaceae bacterium]
MMLSVIIITKNESAHIADCIASVSFADEIIVVDSGSTDDTRDIAAALGAKVTLTPDWPGFGQQKNRALDLAQGTWVLSIDADERVTPELAAEIQRELTQARAAAYKISRLSNFGGRWIRHCGWWPDQVLRLFRRDSGRFKDVAVHESVETTATVATLKSHFLHYPYADLESFIAKINHYSSEAAQMMYARGKRTSLLGAIGHSVWTFVRIYLMRRGFMDGKQGFILAAMGAAGSFFRYNKLLWLQNQDSSVASSTAGRKADT